MSAGFNVLAILFSVNATVRDSNCLIDTSVTNDDEAPPRLSPERKSDPDLEAIVLSLARRPASTPRDRLIGGAARIIELKTQINNYLPANAPDRTIWRILDCLPGLVARAPARARSA